jgi:hypothetical protein
MRLEDGLLGNPRRMESGEERIDEEGRNPTQRSIDEDGPDERPADVDWENEPAPHEGEEGTDPTV